MEILQWARDNGAPWDEDVCAYAAYHGHLEILQWARRNGAPWDIRTCAYAAEHGHLDIIKWTWAHGAPWNARTCLHAALRGRLEVLRWALTPGAPWSDVSFQLYEKELQTPQFRRVAICLMKFKHGTPKTDAVAVKFIHELYTVLPLIAPLCDLVINYC